MVRVPAVANRFVQADGGPEPGLEFHVPEDVVVLQGLLHHQQVEPVEFGQVVEVLPSVGGVGVHHERDPGKALADGGHDVEVPTGLDLDLDPLVSGLQFLLDLAEENVGMILDADGDPARNPAMASPQELPQRHARRLGLEVPQCGLQTSLRHGMSPDRPDPARKLVRPAEADAQHPRDQEPAQDRPDGVHRLITESGRIVGDALAPTGESVRPDLHQQDPAAMDPAEAGLEEMDEGKADFANDHPLQLHSSRFPLCPHPPPPGVSIRTASPAASRRDTLPARFLRRPRTTR